MAGEKGTKSGMWLRFFREAGIPLGFDTKYALLFDENRIKMDMLMDLNKECLKDMGITAMGDIIAILKHASKTHEESKAQAYDVPQPTSTVKSSLPVVGGGPKSVVVNSGRASTTVLKTGTGLDRVASPGSAMKQATVAAASTSRVAVKATTTRGSNNGSSSNGSNSNGNGNRIVKLKRSVSPPQREEVPVQKKTRVLPEQEGKYIVKMPAGATPRTQKLLQDRLGPVASSSTASPSSSKVMDLEKRKSNVFARLGDSKVSSTSELSQPSVKSKPSVFSRLGQQTLSPTKTGAIVTPAKDRLDVMNARFEVRHSEPSRISLSSASSGSSGMSINDRIKRLNSERNSSSRSSGRSSASSRLGSSVQGGIKARLGEKAEASRDRFRSRSPSPHSRSVPQRRPSPLTQLSAPVRPRVSAASSTTAKPAAALEKTGTNNLQAGQGVSVSRQVVREERFTNAEGKNMVRKVILKTIRKV